jgi:hypothetical protein
LERKGQSWQDAEELNDGDLVRTPTGAARVNGFDQAAQRFASAYNLTVADIHTYYVMAGDTPVLASGGVVDSPTTASEGVSWLLNK